MPYRTASAPPAHDADAMCLRCAARTPVQRGEAQLDFTCAACGLAQPVLPDARTLTEETGLIAFLSSDDGRSYEQLAPFARSIGGSAAGSGISVRCDGATIKVGLSINSGTVVGVDFSTDAGGLPDMRLVVETDALRDAKERRVIREAQTGDEAFDRAVYIESEATEETIRAVLSSPRVRLAIREQLRESTSVAVRRGTLTFGIDREGDPFAVERLRDRVLRLRAIAGALRPRAVELVATPRGAKLLNAAVFLTAPIALASAVCGLHYYTPIALAPVVESALVGLAIAVALQPLFVPVLRGRSTSHSEIKIARIVSVIWLPVLAVGLLTTINGVLDRSREQLVDLAIESRHGDADDASKLVVTAKEESGVTHTYTVPNQAVTNDHVIRVGWRAGRLGWTWESRAGELASQAPR